MNFGIFFWKKQDKHKKTELETPPAAAAAAKKRETNKNESKSNVIICIACSPNENKMALKCIFTVLFNVKIQIKLSNTIRIKINITNDKSTHVHNRGEALGFRIEFV